MNRILYFALAFLWPFSLYFTI